jgi:membrane protein DedA with SNARE-associated domain/membrane-associated phospholipid phosphatase
MTGYIQVVVEYVGQHPTWAGLLVFVTAATEAIAVIGLFIPGTAILVGIGAIAGLGHLSLWSILVWAALGAIAGDGVSYWFGRRYRHRIVKVWPFSTRPDLLAHSEAFIVRHGAKSVAIGRFVPALRAFVPLAAGVFGMSRVKFYVANVLSALVWSPAHIMPGAVLGISFGVLEGVSSRLAVVLLLLVAVVGLAGWLLRIGVARLVPLLDRLRRRAGAFLRSRRRQRLAGALYSILDPAAPGARGVLLLGLVLALGIVGFLGMLQGVAPGDLARADAALGAFVRGLRTPWSDAAMVAITMPGDLVVSLSISGLAIGWLLSRGAWRVAAGFAAALLLAVAFVPALQWALGAPAAAAPPGPSGDLRFAIGHVTVAAVIYGTLSRFAYVSQPDRWRTWPLVAAGSFVGAIAASRVYLGEHWLFDVAGGLLFGFGMAAAFGQVFRRIDAARLHPRGLFAGCLAAALAVGAAHGAASFERELAAHAPRDAATTIALQAWLDGGWRDLPERRIDLEGDAREPVVLQWAGSAAALGAQLLAGGWSKPPAWSAATLSALVGPRSAAASLPVLPTFHSGREPVLTLVAPHPSAETRTILRLWPSGLRIAGPDGTSPLFVASVTQERVRHPLGLFSWPRADPLDADHDGAIAAGRPPAELAGRAVEGAAGPLVLAMPAAPAGNGATAAPP